MSQCVKCMESLPVLDDHTLLKHRLLLYHRAQKDHFYFDFKSSLVYMLKAKHRDDDDFANCDE
jgi:hypothetical protein